MGSWSVPGAISKRVHTLLTGAMCHFRGTQSNDGEWLDTLRRAGTDLETLARSTEGEFLSIGEQLQDFHQRAVDISKISQSVANLLSGKEMDDAIELFHDVIGRIRRLEGESEQSLGALQSVLETLGLLQRQLTGFHKTVRSLRMLCVSIKIESARHGEKDVGFQDLASEVGKLALEVEDRCSRLLEQSESLSEIIAEALNRVKGLLENQRSQAALILDRTDSSLESINERYRLSSEGAQSIFTRYEGISRRIGEIVTSMQFHDITRQRVEHAKEALDRILDGWEEGGNGRRSKRSVTDSNEIPLGPPLEKGDFRTAPPFGKGGLGGIFRAEAAELRRTAVSICELQMAQLRSAGKDLVSAVENIVKNLRGVSSLVEDISHETQKMAGAADETGRSSLDEVEQAFSSVMAALSTYAGAKGELSQVLGSVGQTLGDMSSYIGDVEGIGIRIKLIALNAIVKASHMGTEGATLALLAEAIHHLSVDTCRQTEAVSQALVSITSTSASLCEGLGNDGKGEGDELAQIDRTLRNLLNTLTVMSQETVSLLTRMDEEGHALSNRIFKTVGTVTVHTRVDETIHKVLSQLDGTVQLLGVQDGIESQLEKDERIRALEASYTMEGEREVHQSMLHRGAAPSHLSPAPSSLQPAKEAKDGQPEGKSDEDSEEDLGDNVELF